MPWSDHLLQTSWSENHLDFFDIFFSFIQSLHSNRISLRFRTWEIRSLLSRFWVRFRLRKSRLSFPPPIREYGNDWRITYTILQDSFFLPLHMNKTCSWRHRPRNQIGWQLLFFYPLRRIFTLAIYLPFLSRLCKIELRRESLKILRARLSPQTNGNVSS